MKKRTLLLSYPRSGNTLSRYFIEAVTHQPTYGYGPGSPDYYPRAKTFSHLSVDEEELPAVIKRHGHLPDEHQEMLKKFCNENDRLIFVVRNPMECLVRQAGIARVLRWTYEGPASNFDEKLQIGYFFKNVEFYDAWDREKHILFYEDMILDPHRHWRTFGRAMSASPAAVDEFLENLDFHLERSLRGYGSNRSNGKEIIKYSLDLKEEDRNNFAAKIHSFIDCETHQLIMERFNIK